MNSGRGATRQLSQDPRYFTAAWCGNDFIEAKFVDRTHGDWIESVTRAGKPSPRPRVAPWECPYHSSRSCFELIERVHLLTGAEPALSDRAQFASSSSSILRSSL